MKFHKPPYIFAKDFLLVIAGISIGNAVKSFQIPLIQQLLIGACLLAIVSILRSR